MNGGRTLLGADLAALWRVDANTVLVWHRGGRLTAASGGGTGIDRAYRYAHETIETLHTEGRGNSTPGMPFPTVAELLNLQEQTGTPVLLTIREVAGRIDKPPRTVNSLIHDGKLLATQINGLWRIPVMGVAAYMEAQCLDGALSAGFVAKILGLSTPVVVQHSQGPGSVFERTEVVTQNHRVYITEASMLAFIANRLARRPDGTTFLTPQEWVALRVTYDFDPLLTARGVCEHCHTHRRVVVPLIEDGTLPCLYTMGGQARVPQFAADQWYATRQQIAPEKLSIILGVSVREAVELIASRALCKIPHDKQHCPNLGCLAKYIQAHATSSFTPKEWMDWATQDKSTPVLGRDLIAAIPGMNRAALRSAVDSGMLRAVALPSGEYVIARADAAAYQRRALREMGGA